MTTESSYEGERRARERLPALARGVALALGPGWAADPEAYRHDTAPWRASIGHPDGRAITLCLRSGGRGVRLEVSGMFPPGAYVSEHPCIGMSPERGPEAVAREITRRLLPRYNELYQEAAAKRVAIEARAANAKRWAEWLAQQLGACPPSEVNGGGAEPATTYRLYSPRGETHWSSATVSGSESGARVKVELSDLEPEQARRILASLAGSEEKGGAE